MLSAPLPMSCWRKNRSKTVGDVVALPCYCGTTLSKIALLLKERKNEYIYIYHILFLSYLLIAARLADLLVIIHNGCSNQGHNLRCQIEAQKWDDSS